MNIVDVGGALFFASSATAVPEDIAPSGPDSAAAPDPLPAAALALGSSPSVAAASSAAAPKRAYPAPAELPTQQGPDGIRFDFNGGSRVVLPDGGHPWRVRLSDIALGLKNGAVAGKASGAGGGGFLTFMPTWNSATGWWRR